MPERKRRDVTTPSKCVEGGDSVTGKIFLERSEEVANHRHTPRPSQKPLPGETTHVGHICVMDGEAENSGTHTAVDFTHKYIQVNLTEI